MDGIAQLELAALVQRQERDARDRLRHRIDAEDRVFGYGPTPLEVPRTERAEVADLATPGNRNLTTRDLPGDNVATVEVLSDAFESVGIEPSSIRVDLHVASSWSVDARTSCPHYISSQIVDLIDALRSTGAVREYLAEPVPDEPSSDPRYTRGSRQVAATASRARDRGEGSRDPPPSAASIYVDNWYEYLAKAPQD